MQGGMQTFTFLSLFGLYQMTRPCLPTKANIHLSPQSPLCKHDRLTHFHTLREGHAWDWKEEGHLPSSLLGRKKKRLRLPTASLLLAGIKVGESIFPACLATVNLFSIPTISRPLSWDRGSYSPAATPSGFIPLSHEEAGILHFACALLNCVSSLSSLSHSIFSLCCMPLLPLPHTLLFFHAPVYIHTCTRHVPIFVPCLLPCAHSPVSDSSHYLAHTPATTHALLHLCLPAHEW